MSRPTWATAGEPSRPRHARTPLNWAQPLWDDAGNLVQSFSPTSRGTALTFVWDAWNRLVAVKQGTTTLAAYEHDALGRRVEEAVVPPLGGNPVTTHLYYNDQWQLIEQRVGSASSARAQFVWSAAYVDALVQEQRDTDANGTLDRTLYATHDANFNVTAAVTLGGIAQQRFLYDAYGARSVLAFDWQPTTSAPILVHGHQGGRSDASTGFVLFRHRYLSPGLMRWTTGDMESFPVGSRRGPGLGRPDTRRRFIVEQTVAIRRECGLRGRLCLKGDALGELIGLSRNEGARSLEVPTARGAARPASRATCLVRAVRAFRPDGANLHLDAVVPGKDGGKRHGAFSLTSPGVLLRPVNAIR